MYEKHRRGKWAEDLACDFYLNKNYRLIARNFSSRSGEIDLIAHSQEGISFVEVRLRTNACYGDGLDSITGKKQHRIIQTAQYFLQCFPQYNKLPCRFDVLAVGRAQQYAADDSDNILWIPGAFDASSL